MIDFLSRRMAGRASTTPSGEAQLFRLAQKKSDFLSRFLPLLALLPLGTTAQEALRSSLAGEEAASARRRQRESGTSNVSLGDLRLDISTSLGLEYNDNVTTGRSGAQEDDYIIRPSVDFRGNYPLTQYNYLDVSLGVSYDAYLLHDERSIVRLEPGSQISFDAYLKDIWFNLHDRVSYLHDAASEPGLSGGTGQYGGLHNTAGLSMVWDLQDVTVNLGYDHLNVLSSDQQYEYQNHSSEMPVARVGFRWTPALTTGLEATYSVTDYDQPRLNDNTGYSGGLYADWMPGRALQMGVHGGYSIYDFSQTSQFVQAASLDSWYVTASVQHRISEAISYGVTAGRETRLGVQSDTTQAWFVRPGAQWAIRNGITLHSNFSYESGTQGASLVGESSYEHYATGLGASFQLLKKLTLSTDYRLSLRSSKGAQGYAQNVVGLRLNYHL